MAVHSKNLFADTLPFNEDGAILVTVPAGHTWIVKDVTLRQDGFATGVIWLFSADAEANRGYIFSQELVGQALAHFFGFFVMNEGTSLEYVSTCGDTSLWVSGADLIN